MTDNGLTLAEREPVGLYPEFSHEPAMRLELMGPGSIIEKNPAPVAVVEAGAAATEAILTRLYGQESEEGEEAEDRFTPYALSGDPAEIYGGIRVVDGDVETANAFVRMLIGQVELPEEEQEADARKLDASATQSGSNQETEQTSGLLSALKNSKLGRAAAIAAVSASLFFGHAAEAKGDTAPANASSAQECINDALAPIDVVNTKLRRPNHNGKGQKAFARVITQPMPPNCDSQFNIGRDFRVSFKVGGVPFLGLNLNMSDFGYVNGGVNKVVRLPGSPEPTKWQLTKGIYDCTPGPKKTPVEFLAREIAMDPQTYGVTNWDAIDQKTFPPITVRHILNGGAC